MIIRNKYQQYQGRMKNLSKEDLIILEEFLEPYKNTLEAILSFTDTKSDAELQAWRDWALDEMVDKLALTPVGAKLLINKLESKHLEKT